MTSRKTPRPLSGKASAENDNAKTNAISNTAVLFLLHVVTLSSIACERPSPESKLPPARGEGAPALPELPKLNRGTTSDSTSAALPSENRTTGTTYPKREAQIAVNASGRIDQIPVEQGDFVKQGQILFRQDTSDAALRIAQAKAALSAAEVNLRATRIEHERAKQLLAQNALNRAQWDQTEARLDAAKAGMEQAKVAVSMMEKMLADLVVRAPFAGIVAQKLKNVGEMASLMPPTVVLVLQDQRTLELRFRLPEKAVVSVQPKDVAVARFEALGIERRVGIVRVQPTVDPMTRTVEVVAELANEDLKLKPGLLAEVNLVRDLAASAVPTGAVHAGKGSEEIRE